MRIIIAVVRTTSITSYPFCTWFNSNRYHYSCQEVNETYKIPSIPNTSTQDLHLLKNHNVNTYEETHHSFIDLRLSLEKSLAHIFLTDLETKLNSLYHQHYLPLEELENHITMLREKCQYRGHAAFTFFSKLGFYKDLAETLGSNLKNSDQIKLTLVSKDIVEAARNARKLC